MSNAYKTFQAKRKGYNVELRFHLLRSSNYGVNVLVGTLPEQFRPPNVIEAYISALSDTSLIGGANVQVNPDGTVYASTSMASARWLIGTVGYLR